MATFQVVQECRTGDGRGGTGHFWHLVTYDITGGIPGVEVHDLATTRPCSEGANMIFVSTTLPTAGHSGRSARWVAPAQSRLAAPPQGDGFCYYAGAKYSPGSEIPQNGVCKKCWLDTENNGNWGDCATTPG